MVELSQLVLRWLAPRTKTVHNEPIFSTMLDIICSVNLFLFVGSPFLLIHIALYPPPSRGHATQRNAASAIAAGPARHHGAHLVSDCASCERRSAAQIQIHPPVYKARRSGEA